MQQSTAMSSPIQRRITLIRHAKAEEGDGADMARNLNARGQRDAVAVGEWLRATQAMPAMILCSTAQRTRQTLAALGGIVPTLLTDRLYLASAAEMLRLLSEMDNAVQHIGIVGHNPGLHQLAAMLVRDVRDEADAERLALKFPTAACAIFSLDLPHWRDLALHSATLEHFAWAPPAAECSA